MATLTAAQREEIRRDASYAFPVTWTKPTVNAAMQAIEDWVEANRAALGAAIEAAAPSAFTAAQKKYLVARYFRQKAERDGA